MFNALKETFDLALGRFLASAPMARLASGDLTTDEYRSFLKQMYYVVRENPQLQALATIYFRGHQRDTVRNFYKHAISEVGHDQLALNDYVTLGGDATLVPYRNPLPATSAMTAFAFYQIYNLNPVGYLGYLFFLEYLPTQAGGGIAQKLADAGIPEGSMSFLREHIGIDEHHNRLMERYAVELLKDERDLAAAQYAVMATGFHYEQVVSAALRDVLDPLDTGWNWEELRADGIDPQSLTAKTLTAVA